MAPPSFLVVGAGKTGTTWLHQCLAEHPDVFVPKEKEIRYFSYRYDRDADWYRSFFEGSASFQASGEISPSYMVDREAPKRISAWNPNIRLIFIFRDPIQRSYSHYQMFLRSGKVSEDIDSALTPGHRIIDDSFYFRYLTNYLNLFERDQIRILIYDDLVQSPKSFLRDVFNHIGVEASFVPRIINQKYHATKSRPRFENAYRQLVEIAKSLEYRNPLSNRIIHLIRRSGLPDIFHWFNEGEGYPEMSSEKRKELAELFCTDVKNLSEFTDRDLTSLWLNQYFTDNP